MRNVVVSVASIAICWSPSAIAGVLIPREAGSKPLTLRKQTIEVQVRDQVARATVDEVFENHTDRAIEAQYLLPLPEGSAISGFATWVDGVRVESWVEEKQAAAQAYESAQARGQDPALLESMPGERFQTRVDGIPARGTKRIQASFAQILAYDAGRVSLSLPLAVEGQSGSEPVGDFRLALEISDQKRIAELEVVSHRDLARVTRINPSTVRVELAGKDVVPSGALTLSYRTESSRLGLSFLTYRPDPERDGYFLLLASPQELTTDADIVRKDVVFVFDTSGSMEGERKIDQARAALKRCVSHLGTGDRFGVVAFSDSLNPFRGRLVEATGDNVREAIRFADGLSAGGGTNIYGALSEGLRLIAGTDRPGVVVLMTDGHPTAGITSEPEIAERIRDGNRARARIFTFGVGSDLNRVFLERLANENRGAVGFVDRGQSIDEVDGGFYAKIARPVLSDLSFDFGAVTTAMRYPEPLPDLYKGSQLVVVGRYRGAGAVRASLQGTLNGKRIAIPFDAEFPRRSDRDAVVARIWAQRRIDYLLSQNRLKGESAEARAEVIALSKQYRILTPYTSLVATSAPTLVASVSPARVKPGDPVVRVSAPRNAQVRVVLPSFGQTKTARWSEREQLWLARFLVPSSTPDGSYPVEVEIRHADGRIERWTRRISIDTAAPAIAASASPVRAGQLARLRARAVLGPADIAHALLLRDDRYEALKARFDVRDVTARLWDGREIALHLEPEGWGFAAAAETHLDLVPGRYPVTFTAQDFAGNSAQATAFVEVLP